MHGTEDIFDFYGKTFLASNQLEKGRTINGMMCFTKGIRVTVSDIHRIWTRSPTHNHHELHKQTNFRTSQLCQKQVLCVCYEVCGWLEHSASSKKEFL